MVAVPPHHIDYLVLIVFPKAGIVIIVRTVIVGVDRAFVDNEKTCVVGCIQPGLRPGPGMQSKNDSVALSNQFDSA